MAYSEKALTTVEALKSWLGDISEPTWDAEFTALIQRVSQEIVGQLSRPHLFKGTALTEKYNGRGGTTLFPRAYPLWSVTSLTINGTTIPASPDGVAAGYVFDADTIYLIGYEFTKGVQNVTLVYVAGIDPAVDASDVGLLEQACLELCASEWRGRGNENIASEGIGVGGNRAFDPAGFRKAVFARLDHLRRKDPW